MGPIKESDWKLFRHFHQIALERFCDRVLQENVALISRDNKTKHQCYLELYKLITEKDDELGRLFNDIRRSTALIQLRLICSHSLLNDKEIAQFSLEAQQAILPSL